MKAKRFSTSNASLPLTSSAPPPCRQCPGLLLQLQTRTPARQPNCSPGTSGGTVSRSAWRLGCPDRSGTAPPAKPAKAGWLMEAEAREVGKRRSCCPGMVKVLHCQTVSVWRWRFWKWWKTRRAPPSVQRRCPRSCCCRCRTQRRWRLPRQRWCCC